MTRPEPAGTAAGEAPPDRAAAGLSALLLLTDGRFPAGGRKGGPGVTTADLFVINKTDLAGRVHADLAVMARGAAAQRGDRPVCFLSLTEDPTAAGVIGWVRAQLSTSRS